MTPTRSVLFVVILCVVCQPVFGSIGSWWHNTIGHVKEFGNELEDEAEAVWKATKEHYIKAAKKLGYLYERDSSESLNDVQVSLIDERHAVGEKKTTTEIIVHEEVKDDKISNGCECTHNTCGCCKHLEEPSIELNSTLCANATYLSEDIGISLTVTVNDYAIFNETVSVRNPPPVCLGVPYVKQWAEACLRLYDVEYTKTSLHACAQVEARMKHILVARYQLGCFNIGSYHSKNDIHSSAETKTVAYEPVVMLV